MKIWKKKKKKLSQAFLFSKGGILLLKIEKILLSTQTSMHIEKITSDVPYKQSNKQNQC